MGDNLTICAALVIPGEGAVLACDSRVTAGHGILTDSCDKFLVAGSCVALVSGHDGALMDHITAAKNIEGLRMLACEYTDGRPLNWDLLCYDRRSEKLVMLDCHGSAVVLGDRYATGSGGDVAMGVLSVAGHPRTLESAAKLIRKACLTACRHNVMCGGAIRVLVVRGKRSAVEIS